MGSTDDGFSQGLQRPVRASEGFGMKACPVSRFQKKGPVIGCSRLSSAAAWNVFLKVSRMTCFWVCQVQPGSAARTRTVFG